MAIAFSERYVNTVIIPVQYSFPSIHYPLILTRVMGMLELIPVVYEEEGWGIP